MFKVFKAFGIDTGDIQKIIFAKKLNRTPGNVDKPQRPKYDIKELPIPDHFYKLSDADSGNVIAAKARNYLINERFIDPESYPFYLSTGIVNSNDPKERALAKILVNRLIIPSFRNGIMVYYTARALDDSSKTRYIDASTPKTNVIYGFDKLHSSSKGPLLVAEGFFDAHHLKGVAVLGNGISKAQVDILNSSQRQKVVVPDKNKKGDSRKLAEQALELGWGVAFPLIGSCKDITNAIAKYGKLYVIDSIMKNVCYGNAADLATRNYYNLS